MAHIYMVRHGHAAAGFDVADPGLDELGRSQAEGAVSRLHSLGPLAILTSPLRRARETAMPLARAWQREPIVEPSVAEIPTPGQFSVTERVPWLRAFMSGTWREASGELANWREGVIETLNSITEDSVIFSHFIAINVGLGHVSGDDRVVAFAPDNCSITIFENAGNNLQLIERGREATTKIG